jgi:hypothetical protein
MCHGIVERGMAESRGWLSCPGSILRISELEKDLNMKSKMRKLPVTCRGDIASALLRSEIPPKHLVVTND